MQTLSFQATDAIAAKLEFLAKATERSKAYIIRKALLQHMEDLEDMLAAEEAMKDYDPSKNIPFEEVKARLGLGRNNALVS